MNALAPVGDELAILIPRLGSDSDGEIIAAVKAIGCQLQMVEANWYDLVAIPSWTIADLIPRLGSDSDGEIVAAVKAIGRRRQITGSNWHDLAAMFTVPVVMYQPEPDARRGGVASYHEAVDWIAANHCDPSEKEWCFLYHMKLNLVRGGRPTPKQADWIDALLEKTGGYWI